MGSCNSPDDGLRGQAETRGNARRETPMKNNESIVSIDISTQLLKALRAVEFSNG